VKRKRRRWTEDCRLRLPPLQQQQLLPLLHLRVRYGQIGWGCCMMIMGRRRRRRRRRRRDTIIIIIIPGHRK